MSEAGPSGGRTDSPSTSRSLCPRWCVTGHRAELGEENWLHSSEPVRLVEHHQAQLVMSINPDTGEVDGPYVILGETELTLADVTRFATALSALVIMGESGAPPSLPRQDERR